MPEVPLARGLILCEQTITDARSKNVSLINCFSGLGVNNFPSLPQKFSLFALLTNGNGPCTLRLEVALVDEDTVIYSRAVVVLFPDPLTEVRFAYRVQSCIFPRPAKYAVRLCTEASVIAEAVFRVYQTEFDS